MLCSLDLYVPVVDGSGVGGETALYAAVQGRYNALNESSIAMTVLPYQQFGEAKELKFVRTTLSVALLERVIEQERLSIYRPFEASLFARVAAMYRKKPGPRCGLSTKQSITSSTCMHTTESDQQDSRIRIIRFQTSKLATTALGVDTTTSAVAGIPSRNPISPKT